MKQNSKGLRRYLYENIFHESVRATQERTGRTIMVSAARHLRTRLDAELVSRGTRMDDPKLGIPAVLSSINAVMSEGVEGYVPIFREEGSADPAYRRMYRDFADTAGFPHVDDVGQRVQPKKLLGGPRLPISPYDSRWSTRSTVRAAGSQLRYAFAEDVETYARGDVENLAGVRSNDFKLHSLDEDGQRLVEAGPALTRDDISGMTALMGLMSEPEYRNVRQWVIDGAKTAGGQIDHNRYMSQEALSRSVAILEELRSQGTGYVIQRDRNPGQIRAEIDGTKISVRLTEQRDAEHFVGRVYDDGVSTYYSTNHKAPRSQRTMAYTPSAAEAVDLLRVAQGLEVVSATGAVVGTVGTHAVEEYSRRAGGVVSTQVQDTYYSEGDKSSMRAVGPLVIDGRVPSPGATVFIRRSAEARSTASAWFSTPDAADDYLADAVASARSNLTASLGVDALVSEFEDNAELAELGEYFPDFSGDVEVAAIQRSYWDVLRGSQTTLLRPGATQREYQDQVGVIGELQLDDEGRQATHDMLVADLAYTGTPEQRVRDHAEDLLDEMVGGPEAIDYSEDADRVGRFNPAQVSSRMTSEFGQWRNQADIVAAMRISGRDGEAFIGDGFYTTSLRDRLITFDPTAARQFNHPDVTEWSDIPPIADPFSRRMCTVALESVQRNGGEVSTMELDEQGIIRYTAQKFSRTGVATEFQGEIGQIFGQGEHGEVVTQFASGENYLFAPGYEARIASQRAGEDKSVEERTLLRGYEQVMAERIQYQVSSDMMSSRSVVGEPTTLNGVYRSLYDVRHPTDYLESAQDQGLSQEWVETILATEARRVRYPNEIARGSTVHAAWREENGPSQDPADDNRADAWTLTGKRNMSIMTEASDGYFDPVLTNGAAYQGITRYLVESASVDEQGRIVRGELDDRTPVMKRPELATTAFDPYDRQQMTGMNVLNASAITEPVGVAMMTFGGWTADDPMVVSKEFAEANGLVGSDGERRSLVVGDKLSDLHGNKGVISLVVDRDAVAGQDYEIDPSMIYAHDVFRTNPELSVVMSPFSAVSRFNGGTARELMESPKDLALPFKGLQQGAMGEMRLIVTHKDVESGTRVYDDAALAQGRGRKASSQLAWALGSQGCDEVMAEFYGPNNSSVANFREMLVTMGMDMDPEGSLRIGYDDMAEGVERRLFELPPLVRTADGRSLNARAMRSDFGGLIGDKGGDLEIPFPLRLASGQLTESATGTSWRLPVMSAHLRSGRDLDDGVSTTHDYTNQYMAVHDMASQYRHSVEMLATDALSADARTKHERVLAEAPRRAQSSYDVIAEDLKARRFTGKRNVFKEGIMSSRLPNSATAVWTSDPRLDIDQVAMGPAMAESLGLRDDDHALLWRDPVLRDAGVRYMRVAIDPRLTGVAINPVMDKCFDGDFDGDSVAVVRLTSDAARTQAMQKLTVEANLLDLGQVNEEGFHPLAMQDSLDVKVTQHVAPAFAERFALLTQSANDVHADVLEGEMEPDEALRANRGLVGELSSYYREAMEGQYGDAVLSFSDAQSHMESVRASCIETGAKGSMAKLEAYGDYLGVQIDDEGNIHDVGHRLVGREDDQGVMMATAVKTQGTGPAGMYSQRGVKTLRNAELKAVLELTYPVTQSMLQSKHDPSEAQHKYGMAMSPARALWRGRLIDTTSTENGQRTWATVRDDKGKDVQATQEQWTSQFLDMYTSADGLNVSINPENVALVSSALTDPTTGTVMDMEDPNSPIQERVATLDRLAYGGDFDTLLVAASERENLFDGAENGHFAPQAVQRAQLIAKAMESNPGLDVEEPRVLVNRDVLPQHDPQALAKGAGRRPAMARTVSMPRRPLATFPESEGDTLVAEGPSF